MNPGTLTRGNTYQLDGKFITFLYETINHYVFTSTFRSDVNILRLTYTQVKHQVTVL
jgi:hypothetical protein